jgi:hypothetical protein
MNVPIWQGGKVVNPDGTFSQEYMNYWQQVQQNMQQSLSDEGILAPSQSTGNVSVIETNATPGTLLYNKDTGKLLVQLDDNTFHEILTS